MTDAYEGQVMFKTGKKVTHIGAKALTYATNRLLTGQSTDGLQAIDPRLVGLNLDFISFVWYHTGKGVLHRQAFAPFVASLIEFLQSGTDESLLNPATTCFAVLDSHPSCTVKNTQPSLFWRACVNTPSSDLGTAASFAYQIVHSKAFPGDLLCVQAFDRLRGTLMLTLRGEFIGKEEPVALSLSSLLCAGMIRLLQGTTPAVTFMTLSPWTKSFSVNLQTLLRDDSPDMSRRSILRKRLRSLGRHLLDAIGATPEDDTASKEQDIPAVECRPIMCQTYNLPTLVLIPE
ncbi:hypothetical protein PQX77_007126 [Marasmius sp. AFHP31]|nr:hypothetical protein PQX77_007126 [Marasmius sp. AFHP31]